MRIVRDIVAIYPKTADMAGISLVAPLNPPALSPTILARDGFACSIGRGLEAEPFFNQRAGRLVERGVPARPVYAAPADPAAGLDGKADLDLTTGLCAARVAWVVAVADRSAAPSRLGAATSAVARPASASPITATARARSATWIRSRTSR